MNYQPSIADQLGMLLRRSPLRTIKQLLRKAEEHQIDIDARLLESHYLASGDITDLVDSLVFCRQRGLQLEPIRAMAQQHILQLNGMTLLNQMQVLAELGVTDVDSYLTRQLQQMDADS